MYGFQDHSPSRKRAFLPYLSPPTLTSQEQQALLRASANHPRDHLIFSLALGTGLRLAEIVGLDVGDVFFPDRTLRMRARLLFNCRRAPNVLVSLFGIVNVLMHVF